MAKPAKRAKKEFHALPLDAHIALDDVKLLTGYGRSVIYDMAKKGKFPATCAPGRWVYGEVLEWLRRRAPELADAVDPNR